MTQKFYVTRKTEKQNIQTHRSLASGKSYVKDHYQIHIMKKQ